MRSTQQVWRVRKQVIRKAARRESNSFGTPNSRELAEEFFLNAAESWRKGHPYNGSFKEYALTSIYHDFVDHHRKCEREAVEILTTRVPDVPVESYRAVEAKIFLEQEVAPLLPPERLTALLMHYSGHSDKETAKVLSLRADLVKQHRSRDLARLNRLVAA